MPQLVEKMSCNPSNILGLGRGTLKAGAPADITVIDPTCSGRSRPTGLQSKSKNSPFLGRTMQGGLRLHGRGREGRFQR